MTKETKTIKLSRCIYTDTGEGKAARWNELGIDWPTNDGKGHAQNLNSIPLNGRIVMRTEEAKFTNKK